MPNKDPHLEQAGRNASVADILVHDGTYSEWVVTALFYEALHRVDAYLAAKYSKHPKDHRERQRYVSLLLKHLHTDYRELESESRRARYDCVRFSTTEIGELAKCRDTIKGEVKRALAS